MSRFAAAVALFLALPVLAQQDPADGLDPILQALDDDDCEVRNAAQSALAAWCDRAGERAVTLLVARIRSSSPEVRARVEDQVAHLDRVEEARRFISVFDALAPTSVAGRDLVVFNTGAPRSSGASDFKYVLGWRLAQSEGEITLLEDSLRIRTHSRSPTLPADWEATRAGHPSDRPLPGEARVLDFGALCQEVLDSQDLDFPRPPERVAPGVLPDGAEVALYAYWAFQHNMHGEGAALVGLARRLLAHVVPSHLARTTERDLVDSIGNALSARATAGAFQGEPGTELIEQWRLIARLPSDHVRAIAERYIRGYEGLIAEERAWREPDPPAVERMDPVERADYWLYHLRDVRTCNAFSGDHARVFFDAAGRDRSVPFPPDELVRIGWAALPALISHLDDSRPSRCLGGTGRLGGHGGSLATLGQVCQQVIEKMIGAQLLRGPGAEYWLDRPAVRKAAEAWWRGNDDDVRRLVADLGDEEWSVRDAAERMLIAVGERDESGYVAELVEAATRSTDPEIVDRSARVLASIQVWERYMLFRESGMWLLVDVLTGDVRWSRESSRDSPPVAARGSRDASPAFIWPRGPGARVYVEGVDGLECLDLRTGRTRWRVREVGADGGVAGDSWVGIRATTMQSPQIATRTSLVSGEVIWSIPLDGAGRDIPVMQPLVESGRIFILVPGVLIALDFVTGATLWKNDLEVVSSIFVKRGALYAKGRVAGGPQFVSRINPVTGAQVWRSELQPDREWFSFDDDGEGAAVVLLRGGFRDGPTRTVALDVVTGETRWSLDHPMGESLLQPGGETAWVSRDREVVLVEVATGRTVARRPTRSELAPMTQDGDRLLVVDYGSDRFPVAIATLRASDGQELSTLDLGSRATRRFGADVRMRGCLPLEKRPGGWVLPCYADPYDYLLRFDERIERLTAVHILRPPPLTR